MGAAAAAGGTVTGRAARLVAAGLLLLPLFSCTELFVRVERDRDWLVGESAGGRIVLHYRPPSHPGTSPEAAAVAQILANQELYLHLVQQEIGRGFSDAVLIYLYNPEEAEEAIGTAGGGHAIPERLCYYYTYLPAPYTPFQDPRAYPAYIGAHELVHVVTHRVLGRAGSKLLSEGYAVAIDGWMRIIPAAGGQVARARTVHEWMQEYHDQDPLDPPRILTPTELLSETDLEDVVYYPNAGYFVRLMLQRYGAERVNPLFPVPAEQLPGELERVTGESFAAMEAAYEAHWRSELAP